MGWCRLFQESGWASVGLAWSSAAQLMSFQSVWVTGSSLTLSYRCDWLVCVFLQCQGWPTSSLHLGLLSVCCLRSPSCLSVCQSVVNNTIVWVGKGAFFSICPWMRLKHSGHTQWSITCCNESFPLICSWFSSCRLFFIICFVFLWQQLNITVCLLFSLAIWPYLFIPS
jgi:hypothetical protein